MFDLNGWTLVASGFGDVDTGGGLFTFDGQSVERVDWMSCAGLDYADGRFARLSIGHGGQAALVGEVLLYDNQGISHYLRVDQLKEPHDVRLADGGMLAVSTSTNSILWIGFDGTVTEKFHPPGTELDCWHLNNLEHHNGQLYACCFGRFDRHRDWVAGKHEAGEVFNVETGETLIGGLTCPHTPRFIDGGWVVCNSYPGELRRYDATGSRLERCLKLRNWPRGITVNEQYLFVGESARRGAGKDPNHPTATIAVLDRESWRILDRIVLPSTEVYDLVLVPPATVEALRRGFRTNAVRYKEDDQLYMFRAAGVEPVRLWANGDRIPEQESKVTVTADIPPRLAAGEVVRVPVGIRNHGGVILSTVPPFPVNISYYWHNRATGQTLEGARTDLARSVPPGELVEMDAILTAPDVPGEWELELTLVQEDVRWFHHADPSNALRGTVIVS